MHPTPQSKKTRHKINSRETTCRTGCCDPYLAGGCEGVVDIEQEEFVDWSVGEGFGGHSWEAAEMRVGERKVALDAE